MISEEAVVVECVEPLPSARAETTADHKITIDEAFDDW